MWMNNININSYRHMSRYTNYICLLLSNIKQHMLGLKWSIGYGLALQGTTAPWHWSILLQLQHIYKSLGNLLNYRFWLGGSRVESEILLSQKLWADASASGHGSTFEHLNQRITFTEYLQVENRSCHPLKEKGWKEKGRIFLFYNFYWIRFCWSTWVFPTLQLNG